jgi:hypothetical protein
MKKIKYEVKDRIVRAGYPTNRKVYPKAHAEADQAEKRKYPVGYLRMKTVDNKLKKNELSGTHTTSGKVSVSKKVPSKFRKEVAYHEFEEIKSEKRLCAKCFRRKGDHK